MIGFLNLYKEKGMTSSDAVVAARRALNFKYIGHTGTLDPAAEGVLPLALGKAAKLFDYLIDKKKSYRASFRFGAATDTLDGEGKITEVRAADFTETELLAAAKSLTGAYPQIPPAYSRKSVGGVRAYDLARRGVAVTLPPKNIEVYKFDFAGRAGSFGGRDSENGTEYYFNVECSGGTYVRALARDLAAKLGTVGYMSSLIRTASGAFTIDKSVKIAGIKNAEIYPVNFPLTDFPCYNVSEEIFLKIKNGVVTAPPDLPDAKYFFVRHGGEFVGVGFSDGGRLKIKTNLM